MNDCAVKGFWTTRRRPRDTNGERVSPGRNPVQRTTSGEGCREVSSWKVRSTSIPGMMRFRGGGREEDAERQSFTGSALPQDCPLVVLELGGAADPRTVFRMLLQS